MDYLPTLELLESTHAFPGPYMFKVIGAADDGFAARVIAAVRDELRINSDPPHRLQQTASGRHVSVTLEPRIESARQVIAVYDRIRETAGLIMMW